MMTALIACTGCHSRTLLSVYDGRSWHAYTDGELAYKLNQWMNAHMGTCLASVPTGFMLVYQECCPAQDARIL